MNIPQATLLCLCSKYTRDQFLFLLLSFDQILYNYLLFNMNMNASHRGIHYLMYESYFAFLLFISIFLYQLSPVPASCVWCCPAFGCWWMLSKCLSILCAILLLGRWFSSVMSSSEKMGCLILMTLTLF